MKGSSGAPDPPSHASGTCSGINQCAGDQWVRIRVFQDGVDNAANTEGRLDDGGDEGLTKHH